MIVGCLRHPKKPNHFIKTLAIMSNYYGVDFIYLNPDDIKIGETKIEGRQLINNKWTRVTIEIPKFIDVKSTLFNYKRYRKKLEYIKNVTTISVDKRLPLPKDKLHDAFGNDPIISKYLIPSININNVKDVHRFINEHNHIVLKPVRSNGGKNVYVVKKVKRKYVVGVNKDEMKLSKRAFDKLFNKTFKNTSVIAQKFIVSQDLEGNPVDCRIHVEKNINGKWKNVSNYIRVGIGQKVVSNISQGGGVIGAKQFVKLKFPDDWKKVYEDIKHIANVLPYKFDELLNWEYMTLGFDIGIDEEGQLHLFEINDNPIVDPIISQVALSRAGYYKYMLENK